MSLLSIAVCTYNREKYLPQLFRSIARQTLPADAFELIIVDNNSSDSTAAICRNFHEANPQINYAYYAETRQGLSFARNRAIKESKGAYIAFLDDDAYPADDYFELLVRDFSGNDDIAAIGGKILLHYESVQPDWENKYLNSLLGYYNPGEQRFEYKNKDYPRGSNMAFRLALFREIGLFNVQLGRIGRNLLGGEEKDLFLRIYKQRRYRVLYDPSLIVFHSVPPERTTRAFIERQAYQTGISERTRSRQAGKGAYLARIAEEMYKWAASLILFCIYWLRGKKPKGKMILTFRIWVTKGLIGITDKHAGLRFQKQ